MNRNADDLDRVLDQALAEIREETLDPRAEQAALERVRGQVVSREAAERAATAPSRQRLQVCADYQALIPDYRDGRLAEARRLLVEDHLGACVGCRRVLRQGGSARSARPAGELPTPTHGGRLATWGWGAAAAVLIGVALFGLSIRTNLFSFETGGMIRIRAIDGEAFRVSEQGSLALTPGQTLSLKPGETLRTAKGSAAVIELSDQSKVELRERTELAVKERRSLVPGRRSDGVIALDRGSVIVEASPQGSGHLYVDTDACHVAVTGTVFSVNHGMKGSRVSVIEGEVRVRRGGDEDVLQPGQQLTTSAALGKIPVEQEIAWSQNVGRYTELLAEVRSLGREMDAAFGPDQRYSTALLDIAPKDTAVYISIPNVSGGLAGAYEILQQRVAASDVLREWWEESVVRQGADKELERIVDEIRAWGSQLGDEVVLALPLDESGHVQEPLLLAQLAHPEAFRDFLDNELAASESAGEGALPVQLFEGGLPVAPADSSRSGLYLWRRGQLLAASPEFGRLRSFAEELGSGGGLAVSGSAFHGKIAERYARGVEWVFGVDVGRFLHRGATPGGPAPWLEELGLLDAEHLIAEHRGQGQKTENRAELTFDQVRRGAAAWLAAPAPVGSLDFVSADASLAAAFVMKDMGIVVDELFDFIGKHCPNFEQELAEFERQHGISVRQDIAAPLGGEFALALDGPILPVPSWKLVLEVYDPNRLQQTMESVVAQVNSIAAQAGRQGLRLERESSGGRDYFHMTSLDTGLGLHYVIEDGYLVAAASRPLIDRALQNRELGTSLPHSARFSALLPQDGEVNFSAVVYQNLGPLVGPLSRRMSEALTGLSPELLELDPLTREQVDGAGRRMVKQDGTPSLAVLYGEPDRIVFVSTSEGGLFTSGLGSLAGFGGLMNVQQSLIQAMEQEAGKADAGGS